MYSSILSASVFGLTARKIRVEADVSNGLPGAVMVGYLAGQVRETMDRVRTALKNSDFALEPKKRFFPPTAFWRKNIRKVFWWWESSA